MFYRKNVGRAERVVRVAGGCLLVVCGLVGLQATALGWILAASGIVTMLTGAIGYCPACAVAGKKPLSNDHASR